MLETLTASQTNDRFDQLLGALGHAMGIEGLSFDAQGCCRLIFDNQRLLELRSSHAQQRLVMSCHLAATPSASQYELLLRACAWGAGTAGGWFALNEKGQLCLQQQNELIDAEAVAKLLDQIDALISSAETWEARLSIPPSESASSHSAFMLRV